MSFVTTKAKAVPGDWADRGLCKDKPIEWRPGLVERSYEKARAICNVCPVKGACRDFALRTEQPFGCWGGMGIAERRALLRR